MRAALRRGLRRAKLLVGDHPVLLPVYLRLTPEGTSRRVVAGTDLVVEGFPRSGTTYAAKSIARAQHPDFRLSNHVHTAATLKVARSHRVPTLLIVRRPIDCLASYLVWDPVIGANTVLWEYVHYHEAIRDVAKHCTVATFDQVTSDLPAVVARVSAHFGLSLNPPPQTEEFDEAVRGAIRAEHQAVHPHRDPASGVPVPDENRATELMDSKRRLAEPRFRQRLLIANRLYDELAALSEEDPGRNRSS